MIVFFNIYVLFLQWSVVFGEDVDLSSYTPENFGKTWMYFPDGNFEPQIADLTNFTRTSTRGFSSKDQIYYHLFTRKNLGVLSAKIDFEDDEDEYDEDKKKKLPKNPFGSHLFKTNKPVKIFAHGWRSSPRSPGVIDLKNAFLKTQDCNVIIVDWETIASDKFYFRPVYYTKVVGEKTARLIDHLIANYGMSLDQFHVIGHSLGAQVAGYTGSFVKSGKIKRITGLDPALPGFQDREYSNRLDKSDALFVDIIHTCSGFLGFTEPSGHVDFYPNGGSLPQPGCCDKTKPCLTSIQHTCSHSISYQFFLESINGRKFAAKRCDNVTSIDTIVHLKENVNENNCQGVINYMGEPASPNIPGVFYLRTT